ncbi:MAG TPA: hypothetical protein VED63_13280 [Acidimicrobiales bacterium]|nr:hypothetical protein [Acidimicrobiales bacterium]
MLLVGTTHGLRDLESGEKFVDGMAVTALAPGGAGNWYVLLDRRFVVLLDADVGSTVPAAELAEPDGQSLAVLPNRTVAVGRTGARVTIVGPHGELRDIPAFQAVPGRDRWENPAGPTPDTRTMAVGVKRWWINVHVGGVWWSEDVGETWHGAVKPGADVHEVRADAGGRVAVAAAVGFGWSEDDGGSWSWTTDGLHATYLRAVALDGDTAFVSASDGPFTRSGAVYRSRLGSSFVRCEAGLPDRFDGNVDSGHLDAAEGRVALGFRDQVYLSEDKGRTWRVSLVPEPVTAVRFAPG